MDKVVGVIVLVVLAVTVNCMCVGVAQGEASERDRESSVVPIYIKNSYAPSVMHTIEASFPSPISVSPDTHKILLETFDRVSNTSGLSVWDMDTESVRGEVHYKFSPLRVTWLPGSETSAVSYFVPNDNGIGRKMHIWNFVHQTDTIVPTPAATAEQWPSWSPDGSRYAYIESDQRTIVVVHAVDGHFSFNAIRVPAKFFAWSQASDFLAVVTNDSQSSVQIMDLRGNIIGRYQFPWFERIMEFKYCNGGAEIIVVGVTKNTHAYACMKIRLSDMHVVFVYKSSYEIIAPRILHDESGAMFEEVREDSKWILRADFASGGTKTIDQDSYVNELGPITTDDKYVYVINRSDGPTAVCRINLLDLHHTVVYLQSAKDRPHLHSELRWIPTAQGKMIPVYLWQADVKQKRRIAVVQVLGLNNRSSRYYQDEPAIAHRYNATFVSVNYRGMYGFGEKFANANSIDLQVEDIRATCEYLHITLGIAYANIAILGYSKGASIVAATIVKYPQIAGTVALVGYEGKVTRPLLSPLHALPRILAFYGKYERYDGGDLLARLRQLVGPHAIGGDVSIYKVNDTHAFTRKVSRASIYTVILQKLNASLSKQK